MLAVRSASQQTTISSYQDKLVSINSEFETLVNSTTILPSILEVGIISKIKNSTSDFNDILHLNQTQYIKDSALKMQSSANKLKEGHSSLYKQFEEYKKSLQKKNLKHQKNLYKKGFVFYNSMSLIMICFLTFSLLGVILLLTSAFTAKEET